MYTFTVKNSTQETIVLKFLNDSYNSANESEVTLLPSEEKMVRLVDAPLNSPAHDCLNQHGIAYFIDLVFDTYINGEKLDRQLWQSQNWYYAHSTEYKMNITEDMIR